jgi:hypothetical protein
VIIAGRVAPGVKVGTAATAAASLGASPLPNANLFENVLVLFLTGGIRHDQIPFHRNAGGR